MKKLATLLVFAVVLMVAPLSLSASDADVVGLVDKAVGIWKDKGKNYALKLINASAGPLRKGGLYVFAVDFKGQNLAHPAQQDLRGHDHQWKVQDANGKFIIQEFTKAAQSPEGFGWVEYEWIRVHETKPTKKRTFIKRVPGEEAYVGSGYYVQ